MQQTTANVVLAEEIIFWWKQLFRENGSENVLNMSISAPFLKLEDELNEENQSLNQKQTFVLHSSWLGVAKC